MTINSKFSRKTEDEKSTKKALLKVLEALHKDCIVHCRYLPNKDKFFVCCYVDRNDDESFTTSYYDYDEAFNMICDATIV